jgi:hypothetical protein
LKQRIDLRWRYGVFFPTAFSSVFLPLSESGAF